MNNQKHILNGLISLVVLFGVSSGIFAAELLPNVPPGAQAVSLFGEPLYAAEPNDQTLRNLMGARADYDASPNDADTIVWYGRRVAYAGDYRRAIEIFSEGIAKFPEDPRFYRHRGHRYISIREFGKAISDFELAVQLMRDVPNQIEPDGLPNSQNIPLTTTQGNVWYHLGLSYYLIQDWEKALAAFQNGYNLGSNDDNLVSTGHWIYMILRRMGKDADAEQALDGISPNMNIIENMSYHQLCLLYKGQLSLDDMMAANGDDPSNAAVAYGIANYLYYNGDKVASDALLQQILAGSSWSSFGFIAAEADLNNTER